MEARLDIRPCDSAACATLSARLGVSAPLAQVLVRRGLGDPDAARAWLAAADTHDVALFAGLDDAVATILRHVAAGSKITIHGDYDVDGICSTAILVHVLRALGASVDWFLPSRSEDGYGLQAATVERLRGRGTGLIVTADCAITAVEAVAAARAQGIDVVVTDHHAPRADGALPDAPIVHPGVCGYPCPELCAAGVAHKLAGALYAAAGEDAARADEDLDLVALATVADCVPLVGENRRLVRAGLRAIATTSKPGLRALLRVSRSDPSRVDATTIGFRLAPRLNAAGRMRHADVGLELVLTEDEERAATIAAELDTLNGERRFTEERIRFAAEAQVAALGPRPAYVLVADDWHAGVIGIVAARIAERHHRPTLMIAMDGDQGTASGRSIPAFDLLGGLDACADHLLRHGGHRAAAGATVARASIDALREAFCAHAAATLRPEDLVPTERVDAVVAGDELGLALAEELARLEPFGIANPRPTLLVPTARLTDARPMGEGKHVRFTLNAGGARASAVAFGTPSLPPGAEDGLDVTVSLEIDEYRGGSEPRLILRKAIAPTPEPVRVVGEPETWAEAVRAELAAPLDPPSVISVPTGGTEMTLGERAGVVDRRGGGTAGTIAALVATGERVLVVAADAAARHDAFEGRIGGFALTSWRALERGTPGAYEHVVVLDPPPPHAEPPPLPDGARVHLVHGADEERFAAAVHAHVHDLRAPLAVAYRTLRDHDGDVAMLPGANDRRMHPLLAARVLRVLDELGLVALDPSALRAPVVPGAGRRELEDSPTFRAATARLSGAPAVAEPAAQAA